MEGGANLPDKENGGLLERSEQGAVDGVTNGRITYACHRKSTRRTPNNSPCIRND